MALVGGGEIRWYREHRGKMRSCWPGWWTVSHLSCPHGLISSYRCRGVPGVLWSWQGARDGTPDPMPCGSRGWWILASGTPGRWGLPQPKTHQEQGLSLTTFFFQRGEGALGGGAWTPLAFLEQKWSRLRWQSWIAGGWLCSSSKDTSSLGPWRTHYLSWRGLKKGLFSCRLSVATRELWSVSAVTSGISFREVLMAWLWPGAWWESTSGASWPTSIQSRYREVLIDEGGTLSFSLVARLWFLADQSFPCSADLLSPLPVPHPHPAPPPHLAIPSPTITYFS